MPDDDVMTNEECALWLEQARENLAKPPEQVQYPPLAETLRKLSRFTRLVTSGGHQPHNHPVQEPDQSP